MRSDYTLYVVAIIFFIITGITFALQLTEFERNLWVVTTAVLGLLFAGIGYYMRPKPTPAAIVASPPPPARVATPTVIETVEQPKTEIIVEAAPKIVSITEVKGIKEKRAEQLKTLGISSIQDLANASAEDLASKLKISPKITIKWIENAKQLLEKS